tara:strand:- start:98 stop:727 length:630 start_codon:yes stop_codon:yes gene_type:complete
MKEKDELLQIFPIPVLITKYEHSIEEEFKFIENLRYVEQKENGNFKTDDTYLLKHKELSKIKDFIYESLNKFTQNIYQTKQRLVVTQCWANKNPPNSKHHEHVHPNSIVSGVFYFRQSKTLPPIQFSKAIQDSFKLSPEKYNQVNSETFLLPMVDGELVLFPSTLRHSVPINRGNETRYSMSFNTFCIDELGSRDSLTHLNIRELYGQS